MAQRRKKFAKISPERAGEISYLLEKFALAHFGPAFLAETFGSSTEEMGNFQKLFGGVTDTTDLYVGSHCPRCPTGILQFIEKVPGSTPTSVWRVHLVCRFCQTSFWRDDIPLP